MEGAAESGPGGQVADSSEPEQSGSTGGAVEAAAGPGVVEPEPFGAVGDADAVEVTADGERSGPNGRSSRVGRRWVIGIVAGLLLASAGLGAGGYLSLRGHRISERIDAANAAAVAAAKECVTATQVPASDDMVIAEQKVLECATGQFYVEALQNAGVFVHAFKLGQVHTGVAEIRAAAERDNPDGSIDVLVAFRVRVDNIETQGKEYGYRLRAQMVPVDGAYRIANLQQVAR